MCVVKVDRALAMGGKKSTERQSSSESFQRQQSAASITSSEEDPLCLPFDVVLHIFGHVPPVEIVRVCISVCKSWHEFFKDPVFWKPRMTAVKNFDGRLEQLSKPIHWGQLCVHTVHEPNLCRSFVDGSLSLDAWTISYEDWDWFSDKYKRRADRDLDQRRGWSQGGGNGWTIEDTKISPSKPEDAGVLKDNCGSKKNYATSYEWCCREQVIDLRKAGFTQEIMDSLQPCIDVSEWFAAQWDCGSIFNLRIDLLNEKRKTVKMYECSRVTEQWQGGDLGWRKEEHQFTNYGSGVRYVRFADAGKDTKWWAGHYGSKMAGAWVRVRFQSRHEDHAIEKATSGVVAEAKP